MLQLDHKLHQKTNGQVGDVLENAITQLTQQPQKFNGLVFGEVIPIEYILLNERNAKNLIHSIIQQYWGTVDLFTHHFFREVSLDIETMNEKLYSFLSSKQGKQAIFDYLLIHHKFSFNSLVDIVFGKEIESPKSVSGLRHIYLYKINKQYFVHVDYHQQFKFWNMLFLKKTYSIFMQMELENIYGAINLMKRFYKQLSYNYTNSQSVIITNKIIQQINFQNRRSYLLKELHLFNITIHFTSGKRHYKKVPKMISEVIQSWKNAHWMLTDKEQTSLTYMLIIDTYQNYEIDQTIEHGLQLIKKERLNDHAIELLLEYSDVLPNFKPEPDTLVKQYDKNFLEQVFYILIDALVQKKRFDEVIQLLKDYEIASCKSIYHYINHSFNDDLLHQIEATVQRNIALIVDQSLHHVLSSIETWLKEYKQSDRYIDISTMTSIHVCNLLKSLFATHHYDLFEKLMEVYNKYLKIDDHFDDLKQFISTYINNH